MKVNREYAYIFIFNNNTWASDWIDDRIEELEDEEIYKTPDDPALNEFIEQELDPLSDDEIVALVKKTEAECGKTIEEYLVEYGATEEDYLDPSSAILEV